MSHNWRWRRIDTLLTTNLPRKRKRGPTQMRSVWGRRESEGPILVSCNRFGQADDKNGHTLSSFIGSMIRDGKFAPLTYESWHKVPEKVKDDLWEKAKKKYNLQEISKKWALQKFGRQLNSWKNRVKNNCYKGKENLPLEELQNSKDTRVFDEHFEYLVNHWSTEKAKATSKRNKIARSCRKHNHTTGTKSFARVAKEQEQELGRPPTRVEMFKHVMTKKMALKNKMSEKEKEHPELATVVDSQNDLYAQVMGREKHGRARMYGAGVSPSIAFNDLSSSKVNHNALIKTLLEHNNKLQNELDQWKSQTNVPARVPLPAPEIEHVESDPTQSPDDISPIIQVANRRTPENKTVDSDSTQPPDDITPIYQVQVDVIGNYLLWFRGTVLLATCRLGVFLCLKSIIKQT